MKTNICPEANQPGHSFESLSKPSSGEAFPISPFLRNKDVNIIPVLGSFGSSNVTDRT